MAAKAKAPDKEPEEDVETEESAEGASAPTRKLPLRLLAIIGAGVLLTGGLGTAGYFLFGGVHESKAAPGMIKPAVFVDLPEVLVNLSNTGSDRTQYLKVKVVLELPDALLMQQIQPVMPRIMDTFQTYLRELRPTDLDGSAGLYRLKEELTRRVNLAIAPNKVNAVLFKEIVVQ
jgi:flagellar FliL protein